MNGSLTDREVEHNKQIAREKVAEDSRKLREEIIARDKAYNEGIDLKEQQRKAESELKVAVQRRKGAVDVLDETTEAILKSPVDIDVSSLLDKDDALVPPKLDGDMEAAGTAEWHLRDPWVEDRPTKEGWYKAKFAHDTEPECVLVRYVKQLDSLCAFVAGVNKLYLLSVIQYWSPEPIGFAPLPISQVEKEPFSGEVANKMVDIEQDEE